MSGTIAGPDRVPDSAPMRILHTSDWHLGIHCGPVSRAPDHDLFFAWLLRRLGEDAVDPVDVLIIAGDIFDAMQPSADAQQRYFRLLSRISATGIGQVLVVGGNHDSAKGLQAPASVLEALDVTVIGGVTSLDDALQRCVVPLKGRDGEVQAVALAVPFVNEFRLGVRTTDLDTAAVREAFRERFSALYSGLADRAAAAWPNLPIIATGHLTMAPVSGALQTDDAPERVHMVGTIGGLPTSVLDPRIAYTALGHIHRSYPVNAARNAWFSGSPIAFSLPEARTPRRVLVVDVQLGEAPRIEKVDVPVHRALVEIQAEPDELLQRLRALKWDEPLPPLVFLKVVMDARPSDLGTRVHEALGTFDPARRPVIADITPVPLTLRPEDEADIAPRPLREMEPIDVFTQLCAARGLQDQAEQDALNAAFTTLIAANEADFSHMVAAVQAVGRGGEAGV